MTIYAYENPHGTDNVDIKIGKYIVTLSLRRSPGNHPIGDIIITTDKFEEVTDEFINGLGNRTVPATATNLRRILQLVHNRSTV